MMVVEQLQFRPKRSTLIRMLRRLNFPLAVAAPAVAVMMVLGWGCDDPATVPSPSRAVTRAASPSTSVESMPKEPRPGDVFVEKFAPWNASLAMVYVPGGTFWMGSPDEEPARQANEGPRHQVRVEPFWMGQCEVKANLVEIWLDEWRQATREQGKGLTPEAMRAATKVPSSIPYASVLDRRSE